MTFRVSQRRRAFALITAIGVMVLLGIIAFGAATTAHFTQGFANVRQQDKSQGDLLREAAYLLEHQRPSLHTDVPISVLRTKSLQNRDVEVSGTLVNEEQGASILGAALVAREGDQIVELATQTNGHHGRRTAMYLINMRGARNAPILLLERRL